MGIPIALFLISDAALLALGASGILLARSPVGSRILYTGTLTLSLAMLGGALLHLVSDARPIVTVLPLGLPWIGACFRIDALSTFFLVVINLGERNFLPP